MVSPSLFPLKCAQDNDWLHCDGRESFVQIQMLQKNIADLRP